VMHDVQLLQRSEFERHGLELWANGFMDMYSLCTTLGPTAGLFASGGHTRGTQEGAQPQQRSVHDLVPLAFGGRKLWDRKLELSDWEAKSLTPEQQRYAASVAWVGREMLRILYERERGAHRDNLLKYLQQHCTLPIDKENLFPYLRFSPTPLSAVWRRSNGGAEGPKGSCCLFHSPLACQRFLAGSYPSNHQFWPLDQCAISWGWRVHDRICAQCCEFF